MQMQKVRSSTIEDVGYDEHTHTMRVSFRHDMPREFCHVPEQTFKAFLNARSKNRFYKRHIQDAFPC
ncbi:KTSC domain-containing protein [Methylomonas subterranea]